MTMFNRFDITKHDLPKDERSKHVTIEVSRYDLEIIKRSLEESYFRELKKTPWINTTPDTYPPQYPPQYGYKGNKITNRLKSILAYIKKQTLI